MAFTQNSTVSNKPEINYLTLAEILEIAYSYGNVWAPVPRWHGGLPFQRPDWAGPRSDVETVLGTTSDDRSRATQDLRWEVSLLFIIY